jgi:hypothetical protein
MLPSDDRYGPWAAGGEIDVMVSRGTLHAVLSQLVLQRCQLNLVIVT